VFVFKRYNVLLIRSDMICSNMDNMMGPVVHSGDLPGIQDGYNLAISDYLGGDIPCYPSMQSDLHGGIGANDSEVRHPD
jgi:hypothetical protein